MQAKLIAVTRPDTPHTTWQFEVPGHGTIWYWCGHEAWTYKWRCEGGFDTSILDGIINAHHRWRATHKGNEMPIGAMLTF